MAASKGVTRTTDALPAWYLAAYNAAFWAYFMGSCPPAFVGAVGIWAATAPFDKQRRLLHQYTCRWASHYVRYAPGVGVKLEGLEAIDRTRPYVIVSNHLSLVDALAVFSTRLPFKWVSKTANFFAPFIGWNMVLNQYVPLRRGNVPSTLRMYRQCLRLLKEGMSVYVFPEGTRSEDGELLPFKRGAFSLAARADVAVLPLIVEGTQEILPKGTARVAPYPLTVRALAPVEPARFGHDSRALSAHVRSEMTAAQRELRGKQRAGVSER